MKYFFTVLIFVIQSQVAISQNYSETNSQNSLLAIQTSACCLAVKPQNSFENESGFENVYITWIGVIDNGEGDDRPHGPEGNLHLQLYDCSGNEVSHTIITGPSNNEWLDGDEAHYCIYIGNSNCVYNVKIWESDKGGSMWMFGRKDEILYQGVPNKIGIWYSGIAAYSDAVANARYRGANSWAKDVWNGGIQYGMPAIFLRVSTFCN